MDINDNQQINTFVKGMNTDVSDALMDSSQYRYAENVRLVTNTDSNSGELRTIEGVSDVDGWLTDRYRPGISEPVSILDNASVYNPESDEIKAMTSIRNLLIVIANDDKIWQKDTSSDSDWVCKYKPEIWNRQDFDTDEEFNKKQENESFGDHLSLVTRWETDKLIKLYIADGKHPMMYINLAYNYTITGINNIYLDIQQNIKELTVSISQATGTIQPAKVQYTYRYYKEGGATTSIAPMSNVLSLYKSFNKGFAADDQQTNKAVDIVIPESPISILDKIQIFRIVYNQIGQLPTVSLIYDDKIISNFTDVGYDIEVITLEDLLSYVKMTFIPKVIESKNDYLFAANIEYNQSDFEKYLEDNNVSERIKAPSTGCDSDGYNIQFNSENILNYDIQNWYDPIDYQQGQHTPGGSGEFIKWEYVTERIYTTLDNKKYTTYSNSINDTSVLIDQVQSLRHGEVYRYGAVLYNINGQRSGVRWIADIMIPEIDKSYFKYSNGDGPTNNLPVRFKTNTSGSTEYMMYKVGIKFTVRANLFNTLKDIVAVEIVRQERTSADRICLTQGIIGFPYRVWCRESNDDSSYTEKTQYLCPPGFFSTNYISATSEYTDDSDCNQSRGISTNEYLIFASPEQCYQPDDIKSLLDSKRNNLYICPAYVNVNPVELISGGIFNNVIDLSGNSYMSICSNIPNKSHSTILKYSAVQNDDFSGTGLEFTRGCALQARDRYIAEQYNQEDYYNMSTFHCSPFIRTFEQQSQPSEHIRDPKRISTYSFVDAEDPSNFFTGEDTGDSKPICTIDTALTVMNNDMFMHWTNPMFIRYKKIYPNMSTADPDPSNATAKYPMYYPTGSSGRCIIMKLGDKCDYDHLFRTTTGSFTTKQINFQTVNIKTKCAPYGGKNTITQGSYLSFGNIAYRSLSQGGIVTYNDSIIDVYDGDCYPGVFNYCAAHAWYEPNTPQGVRLAAFYSVPIESDIDLSATYGDLYVNINSSVGYYLQDKKVAIADKFTQGEDMYMYNTAYGASPTAIQYSALSYSQIDENKYDSRIHHSELKTNGEHIDNWLIFRANNFIDVDTRFGEITNMRLFKDKLLYWQRTAVGIVSANDRTMLNDVDHNQIILGTGDVLQRYDYISTVYGMKPDQFEAEIQSNTTQYWWDGTNKEIIAYGGEMGLIPLAKVKNCSNYINTYQELDHPTLIHDVKYDEIISSVVNNGSIVYNEQIQQFTSIYTFNPLFRAITNDILHISSIDNIYKWNESFIEGQSNLFDDEDYKNATPKVQYVINKGNIYNKVFDITTFGGRFYGGDNEDLNNLTFKFDTPLKQHSQCTGSNFITNREYDFRLAIPRNNNDSYGGRMRGKTMQCELSSSSNSTDFSLQYIVTKYRMSWS